MFLVLLDTPVGISLGIDCSLEYTTASNFKGFQNIPLGLHFFYYGHHRQSFFFTMTEDPIVMRWNADTECYDSEEIGNRNVDELWQFLAPYPLPTLETWKALSNHIVSTSLEIKVPSCLAIDKSSILDTVNALSFLQQSFILVYLGHSFDSFSNWKSLFALICHCDEAITNNASFFSEFLQCIKGQLTVCPQDLFVDALSKDNFIGRNLTRLFGTILAYHAENNALLLDNIKELREFIMGKFGFELDVDKELRMLRGEFMDIQDIENDPDAPTIVYD